MKFLSALLSTLLLSQAVFALEHSNCEVRVYRGPQGEVAGQELRAELLRALAQKGFRPIEIDGEMMKYDFDALVDGDLYAIESNAGCLATSEAKASPRACQQSVSFHQVHEEAGGNTTQHLATYRVDAKLSATDPRSIAEASQAQLLAQLPRCQKASPQ